MSFVTLKGIAFNLTFTNNFVDKFVPFQNIYKFGKTQYLHRIN